MSHVFTADWVIPVIFTAMGVLASGFYMIRVSVLSPAGEKVTGDEVFGLVGLLDRIEVAVRDDFDVNSIVTPSSIAAMGECRFPIYEVVKAVVQKDVCHY